MRRNLTALACLLLAALGLAGGLLVAPARADNPQGAHSIEDLQALGYSIGLRVDLSVSTCGFLYVISANGVTFPDGQEPVIENNFDPEHPACPATPQDVIQQHIDALLAAFPPPAPPAAAVTVPDTAPADLAPAPQTVTVTVSDPTVDAKLAALQAQLDALSKRVDAVAQANTASWDAFVAAIGGGSSAADAALAARSAGLNALYQLA